MESINIEPIPATELKELYELLRPISHDFEAGVVNSIEMLQARIISDVPSRLQEDFRASYESREHKKPQFMYLQLPKYLNPTVSIYSISTLIGTPVQYLEEGDMIMSIKPMKGADPKLPSYNNSLDMSLHTDLTYMHSPPDALALFCVNEGNHKVLSHFCSFDTIVGKLTLETVRQLCSPKYRFRKPGHNKRKEEFTMPMPIISLIGGLELGCVRYRHELTSPIDQAAATALTQASDLIVKSDFSIQLKQNEAVVFSNKRYLHGRDQFEAYYDNSDRHLLRSYLTY